LTDATNVLLCMPGVALTQRAFSLWEYILSVTVFLADYFLLLQSDVLLSSSYDARSLASLGISVLRNKELREPFILRTSREEYSCGS